MNVGMWLGAHVRASLGVAVLAALLNGPGLSLSDTRPDSASKRCVAGSPTIDCAPGEKLDPDGMSAFGRFVTIAPEAAIAYWF